MTTDDPRALFPTPRGLAAILAATLALTLAGCAGGPPRAPTAMAAPGSAAALAADVCAGRVTSVALVREALERAHAAAPWHLFVTLDDAGALDAARRLDSGPPAARCRPLAGVPIVIKDNIDVAGLPTTAGTPALAGNRPAQDAPVAHRLIDAGAIVIGKTQMHELAFGISGWNPSFANAGEFGVRNAYDRTRSAGGSSSGTGAALGLGVVPAGLGTDTGGSVRIPCAFNGCAALRPTVGRYPLAGIVPISHTRDTAGSMGRSMADVELLDRVVTGAAPVGPATLSGVRLGRVATLVQGLDADTQAVFEAALGRLKAAGATIVDVEMPGLDELNGKASFPIAMYEARPDLAAYLAASGSGVTIEQVAAAAASPDVKGTYQALVLPSRLPGPNGTTVPARAPYDAAMATSRPALQALYRDTFARERLDGLVFPTVPQVAMAADAASSSLATFMAVIRNTDPGSVAGVPGVQVPAGLGPRSGLPVGIEVDGPAGTDRRLVAIGLAIERVLGPLPPPKR